MNRPSAGLVFASAVSLIAILLAMAYSGFKDDMRQIRAGLAGRSVVVDTPCGPIEYADVGRGEPVLAVHGAGGGFDQGLDFAGPLARRGFRVIAMSRFGYLRTPLPEDASAAAQADAHACLLDALKIPRAAVIGVSAGAPSSLQFAIRHPDRTAGLVLLVPAAFTPGASVTAPPQTAVLFDTALRSDLLFWSAIHLARPTLIRAILATPPEIVREAAPGEQMRVDETLRHILPVSARRAGLMNDAAVTSTLARYALERIAAPTLLMSVEDDLFGTYDIARYTAGHIQGARFVGYATGGHVWVGHHAEVLRQIESFLNARPASTTLDPYQRDGPRHRRRRHRDRSGSEGDSRSATSRSASSSPCRPMKARWRRSTMRSKGVRRLPVVNEKGGLLELIAFDDLLDVVAEQLSELTKVVGREQSRETATRKTA